MPREEAELLGWADGGIGDVICCSTKRNSSSDVQNVKKLVSTVQNVKNVRLDSACCHNHASRASSTLTG